MTSEKIPPGYKKTEIGIIPEDWEVKRLGRITSNNGLVRGPFGSSLKKEFFIKKGFKVYTQENAIYRSAERGNYYVSYEKFKELKRFEVKEGDFIVSCSGTIGKIFKIPKKYRKGIINQALLIIRLNKNFIDPAFFYHYFSWDKFQEKIIDNTQGGAMQNLVGINEFKNSPIIYPPLPEQQAIARVLSDVDKLIESLDKLIEKKKLIKKGAMQELLTGKKRLPGFKGEWVRKRLGEIIIENPKSQYNVNSSSETGRYPFFTSGEAVYRSDNYLVDGENLFLADGGEFYIEYYTGKANYSNHVYSFKTIKKICSKFIYYKLYLTSHFITEKYFQGSGLRNLQKDEFKNFEILIPSTLEEQQAIAKILSDMDAEIEALEKKKEKYEKIKKGMMELLLTGKVRLKDKIKEVLK